MSTDQKHPLREAVGTIAGIALVFAFLSEIMRVAAEGTGGPDGIAHLIFAAVSLVGALLLLLNVRYSAYILLPLALGIFFFDVYRASSTAISWYTVISGLSFLVAALLCFMLIRAHKV